MPLRTCPPRRTRTAIFRVGFGIFAVVLAGCEKPVPPPPPTPTPSPTPAVVATPTPVPTPTPIPAVPRKSLSTARLFNGLGLEAKVLAEESPELASQDRRDIDAYRVEVTVRAKLPRPATTVEDFSKNDPQFPGLFRDLPSLLSSAKVSPSFEQLYKLKVAQVERELDQLDQILSRHNFYDCETILELTHPSTNRRALLAIGDMDVNVDGSDGDRNVTVDGSSQFFLPQTSYRWPKLTDRRNPFLAVEENRLSKLKAEQAAGGVSASRAEEIRAGMELAQRRIVDLKKWSFLVSETDPFIVLPGFLLRDKASPFTPGFGDYVIVLYEGRAYPAIVGDAGPSLKMGEASLLICRALNGNSSAVSRPVSNIKVGYVVFPGSASETPGPPDLAAWRARCLELANEIGGLAVDLHEWPNLVKPWPTPTPTPTPTPLAPMPADSVTPTPTPAVSPEPEPMPPFVTEPAPPVPVVTTPGSER